MLPIHDDLEVLYRRTLLPPAGWLIITSHSPVPVLLYHNSSLLRSSQLLGKHDFADFRLEASPYVPIIKSILFSHQQYHINNMTYLVLDDERSKRIWLLVSRVYISGFVYSNDMYNQTGQWMAYKM